MHMSKYEIVIHNVATIKKGVSIITQISIPKQIPITRKVESTQNTP